MRMTQMSAREMFGRARVARLATVSSAGEPHVVPVTFAVIDALVIDTVVIDAVVIDALAVDIPAERSQDEPPPDTSAVIAFAVDHKPKTTTALRRLDNIGANPRVAFLVDDYDEDWSRLWWVRADAHATILNGDLRSRALTALTAKYAQYQQIPPNGVVVGATVLRWTGWQSSVGRIGVSAPP